jgi:hypothetical protein
VGHALLLKKNGGPNKMGCCVVINFGQHYMAGTRHRTVFFSEHATVEDAAVKCAKKHSNAAKIIWLSTPPLL